MYEVIGIIFFGILGWFLASGAGKTQWVRAVDVLVYGPYLIYIALHTTYTFSKVEKWFLYFLGSTTITYNLRNFIGPFL